MFNNMYNSLLSYGVSVLCLQPLSNPYAIPNDVLMSTNSYGSMRSFFFVAVVVMVVGKAQWFDIHSHMPNYYDYVFMTIMTESVSEAAKEVTIMCFSHKFLRVQWGTRACDVWVVCAAV